MSKTFPLLLTLILFGSIRAQADAIDYPDPEKLSGSMQLGEWVVVLKASAYASKLWAPSGAVTPTVGGIQVGGGYGYQNFERYDFLIMKVDASAGLALEKKSRVARAINVDLDLKVVDSAEEYPDPDDPSLDPSRCRLGGGYNIHVGTTLDSRDSAQVSTLDMRAGIGPALTCIFPREKVMVTFFVPLGLARAFTSYTIDKVGVGDQATGFALPLLFSLFTDQVRLSGSVVWMPKSMGSDDPVTGKSSEVFEVNAEAEVLVSGSWTAFVKNVFRTHDGGVEGFDRIRSWSLLFGVQGGF